MNITFKEQSCSDEMRQRFLKKLIFAMRTGFFYIAFVILSMQLLLARNGKSQNLDSTFVTVKIENENLKEILETIEKQTYLRFTYNDEGVKNYPKIVLLKEQWSVRELLDFALNKKSTFTYVQLRNSYIVIKEKGIITPQHEVQQAEIELTELTRSLLVTGTVKDASTQTPLPGVNILVKGTTRGTTTDSEGNFSLDATDNDVLVFTFIGYKPFETQVIGQSVINVIMEADIKALQAVEINAGYWNVKDREKTGNISRITAAEIQNQPVSNPLQALQGRMPGVYIQQANGIPGSNFTVRIRGQNSIASGNDPLYIIDGIPFISESLSQQSIALSILGSAGASPLNSISPSDIESIEVLKDADATAIYGSRGANGVVLITTKKASSGKTNVTIDFSQGGSKVSNMIEMLNTQQYLQMRNEAIKNDKTTAGATDYDINGTWDQNRYTDWQKELIGGTAEFTTFRTSISAGTANTQFLLGSNYQKQGVVFPGDFSVDRIASHFSLTHNSLDTKFKATISASYNVNNSDLLNTDLTKLALRLPPNAPTVYDEDGNLNWANSTWSNPLSFLETNYKAKTTNLISSVSLGYLILPRLEIKANFGINDIRLFEKNSTPSTYFDPAINPTAALASIYLNNSSVQSGIVEPQLSWKKRINRGDLSIFIGGTYQESLKESLAQDGFGFASDVLIENIKAASTVRIRNYEKGKYKYTAIFTRINYNWNGKYILNLTGRRDGSSRFGPGKQFANFGAVGTAWVFSNENFISNSLGFLSFGKIRFSYGTTGNDQIGDYQYLDTYSARGQYLGLSGLSPTRLFNPEFSWETNKKVEAALDLHFLEGHLLLSASYYRNRSSNQLINYPLGRTAGFNSILKNLPATVENKGLELEITSMNITKSSLKWTTSLNVTFPRNKLIAFPNLESSSYASQYKVGEPLNIVKRYHYTGVDPETGIYQFTDANGDGELSDADQLTVVKRGQKFYGGFNNSISFKGIQLDIFFQFVKQTGSSFWSLASWPGAANTNQPLEVLNGQWQNSGDQAERQRYTTFYNFPAIIGFINYQSSDAITVDASFVRLKNISLAYQFPDKWIRGIKSRIYLQCQNLLTITNYFGLDPENTNSSILPPLRTFTAGINVNF